MYKIYLGCDHAGFELKEKIKLFLGSLSYHIEDEGAYIYDPDDDYPDFILKVAKAVAKDPENNRGIILGGSGQGEAMIANRLSRVRAAVYYAPDLSMIEVMREHNNANILSLGARFLEEDDALSAVKHWLETPFRNEERHVRRIKKIDEMLPS